MSKMRFIPKRKTKTSQVAPIVNFNGIEPIIQDEVIIGSIDPALNNPAFRIERRTPNKEFGASVTPLLFKRYDVRTMLEKDGVINDSWMKNLTTILNGLSQSFKHCNYIISERQLRFNVDLTIVGQHILTYFYTTFQGSPIAVCDIDNQLKSKILGAPTQLDKDKLKFWSICKALELSIVGCDFATFWQLRHNTPVEEFPNLFAVCKKSGQPHKGKGKLDDLADTRLQSEAFCHLKGLPTVKYAPSNMLNDWQVRQLNRIYSEARDFGIIMSYPCPSIPLQINKKIIIKIKPKELV